MGDAIRWRAGAELRRASLWASGGFLMVACGGAPGPKPAGEGGETGSPPPAAAVADAGPDLVVPVGVPVVLDGSGSVGVELVWDAGDGTRLEGAAPTHAWSAPGTYTAVLQVRGEDGLVRSDDARVSVHLPLADPAPVSSRALALRADGASLFVVVPEAHVLVQLDTASWARQAHPTCAGPRSVAIDGGVVAVACEEGHQLALHDAATGAQTAVIELGDGARPHGVVGRDGVWWVALGGARALARVEGGEVERVPIGGDPRGLALGPEGAVWSPRWRSGDGRGLVLRVDPDGALSEVELEVDETPDSDTSHRGVPNLIEGAVLSPDGGTVYLPATQANIRRGMWRDGQPLTFDSTLRAALVLIDVATGLERRVDRKVLDERGRIIDIATSPVGDRLFLLHPDFGSITVLDAWSLDITGSILDLGAAPQALVVSPDGGTLYVWLWLDRRVKAYALGDAGSAATLVADVEVLDAEPLDAEVLRGKRLFWSASDRRMARSGYISCASCHPDGREDGIVWDFTDRGEGLRRTISLEGRRGTGMGRVHWSGNFDEIQDFEGDIRNGQGGTGLMSDEDWARTSAPLGEPKAGLSADLDALAAYVTSLELPPASPWPAAPAGEAVFFGAGCADCHPPPLYTDSSLSDPVRHDVGTMGAASGGRLGGPLDGLDTPTLLGAHAGGPWLHDGSAATLEAAVRAHEGLPPLSDVEMADLIGHLLSL